MVYTENSQALDRSLGRDFMRRIIDEDVLEHRHGGKVATRFPPEPNGFLHIGHAKSICLNFGIAEEYNGACHLRFDDTDPTKEDARYEQSIQEDVRWLGFDWKDNLFHASDYFDQMYDYAVELIKSEKAYDPETKSGGSPMGRKVKGTIHWVSSNSLVGEIRLYDRLLSEAHLDQDSDFLSHINPHSLEVLADCRVEASLEAAKAGDRYQFERQGYFFVDPIDSKPGNLVFNRIVTLKDSWGKKQPKT